MTTEKIVYGIHAVTALLEHHPERIVAIFCQKEGAVSSRLDTVLSMAAEAGYVVQKIAPAKLEKLAGSDHHQGIVAQVRDSLRLDEKALLTRIKKVEKKCVILVLEGVQDPHNLGACLRSAEAFGVDFVLLPKDNTAPLNATVSKAACGADQTLSIVPVTNIVRCIKALQAEGFWVVGTSDRAAKTVSELDFAARVVIIMGSEGKGIKRLTLETCDEVVKIPLRGVMNSLNVSVATGICLYECYRK